MFQRKLISHDEMMSIQNAEKDNSIHGMETLLTMLRWTGPEGFQIFKECLRGAKFILVADTLDKDESRLKRKTEPSSQATATNPSTANSPTTDTVRIILLGKPSSGKTSLGNSLLSEYTAFTSSNTKVCTGKEKYITCIKSTVTVIDTPGILDSREGCNKKEIETLLECAILDKPGPHVLLYVVNLQRFTRGEDEHFYAFEKIFEQIIYKYMIVIFTNRRSSDKTVEDMLIEDPQRLTFLLQRCDNRYSCIDNKDSQLLKKKYVDNIYTLIQNTINKQTTNDRFDSMSIIIATDKFHQQFRKTLEQETRIREQFEDCRMRIKEFEDLTVKTATLEMKDNSTELTSQPQTFKHKLLRLFKGRASGSSLQTSAQNQHVTELPITSNQISDDLPSPNPCFISDEILKDKLVKPDIIKSGQLHEKLQNNYASIVNGITPDDLCKSLHKDNVINDTDVQYITTIEDKNRRDVTEALIARVLNSGESAIQKLLECLKQPDQEEKTRIQSKMTIDYYSIIQQNYIKLLNDIEPYKLIESLVKAGVFNEKDQLELTDLQHAGKKAISRELVGMVFYCGDQNYDKFIKCLEETGHTNIARKLTDDVGTSGRVERERGKMPEQQYRVIQSNNKSLLENMQPDILIDHLFEKQVFDVEDLQNLQDLYKYGRENVAQHLIQLLSQCGDHAFTTFITCLQKTGHGKLADKLKRDEVSAGEMREARMSGQDGNEVVDILDTEAKHHSTKQEQIKCPKLGPPPVMVLDPSTPMTAGYYRQQEEECNTRLDVWVRECDEWRETMTSWWEEKNHQPLSRSEFRSDVESWFVMWGEGRENEVSLWRSLTVEHQLLLSLPRDVRRRVTSYSDETLNEAIEERRSSESEVRRVADQNLIYLKHKVYNLTQGEVGRHSPGCTKSGVYYIWFGRHIDKIITDLTKAWKECKNK